MVSVEEIFSQAVDGVRRVADACGVRILLVGAFARDLLLRKLGANASLRRTRDVDFAVRSWASARG